MKSVIFIAILAQLSFAQDMADYDTETVSEWSSGPYLSDLNQQCVDDCNKTCVAKCPEAKLCDEDEIVCGKTPLPQGVWPDCTQDEICVSDDCECKYIFV